MTNKQQRFVHSYLVSLNATEAARQAGYSDAKNEGYRLLRHQEVANAIAAELKTHSLAPPEVLTRLSRIARGSMECFVETDDNGDWILTLTSESAQANLDLVKHFKTEKITDAKGREQTRVVSIELHDPLRALILLAKHYERAGCPLSSSPAQSPQSMLPPAPTLQSARETLAQLLDVPVERLPVTVSEMFPDDPIAMDKPMVPDSK